MNRTSRRLKKRSYRQNCTLAFALDVIGDRWTLLIVRELLVGPKRYNQLLKGLRGMGTNLLAERLKQLKQAGIVEGTDRGSSTVRGYRLTALGHALEETISALVRWGTLLPIMFDKAALSNPEWDIVAMRALFQARKAKGLDEVYQFEIDGFAYFAHVHRGKLDIRTGKSENPSLVLKTDRSTLAAISRGASTKKAIAAGKLALEGSLDGVARMLAVFSPSEGAGRQPA